MPKFAPKSSGQVPLWRPRDTSLPAALARGARVVIVGGGISGSALFLRLARLSARHGHPLQVTLLNKSTCNYCGGLMTVLAYKTLRRLYGYDLSQSVILNRIEEAIYLNRRGYVRLALPSPLISMLRTDRFGETGFDNAFRNYVKENVRDPGFSLREGCVALEGRVPGAGEPGWIRYRDQAGETRLEADYLVLALGLNSLPQPFFKNLARQTRYSPPALMPASVTELDLTGLDTRAIDHCVAILDNLLPGCAVGLIAKRPGWLTLTALNRELTLPDLQFLFSHPKVRELIQVDDIGRRLRCRMICKAPIGLGPARGYLHERTFFLGDLNGFVRVFKDGYTHALQQAYLLGGELFYHAWERRAFRRAWRHSYGGITADNVWGRILFRINTLTAGWGWLQSRYLKAVQDEQAHPASARFSSALRALFTGEIRYRRIAWLFFSGLMAALGKELINMVKGEERKKPRA